MPYFLAEKNIRPGKPCVLVGEEAHHVVLSHRVKVGERVKVQGPDEKRFLCEVIRIGKHEVELSPMEEVPVPHEANVHITLFQSLISEKALDFVLQKATELGAAELVLFNSDRTAAKLQVSKIREKSERWNRILWEASKQSERIRPPQLSVCSGWEEAVKKMELLETVFAFDVSGKNFRTEIGSFKAVPHSLGIVVGPEGGLTHLELERLSALPHCHLVSLGQIVLRAETASLAALAVVGNMLERQ